jgi:hypothetical protein
VIVNVPGMTRLESRLADVGLSWSIEQIQPYNDHSEWAEPIFAGAFSASRFGYCCGVHHA